MTLLTSVSPNKCKSLTADLFIASIDFNNGVFLSRTWPPYEQKAVGIHRVPFLK